MFLAAQPSIAADRWAREIVYILKASSALAVAECQPVGPHGAITCLAVCLDGNPHAACPLHMAAPAQPAYIDNLLHQGSGLVADETHLVRLSRGG